MAKGKLILICQSGGEFKTKSDGTLSYEAGEANAVHVNHETRFDDLQLKLAEMSNLDQKTISIKYFLPGNRRNLITLRNDKDLKRMIEFHGNSITADIFVHGKQGFDHGAITVNPSSEHANGTCRDSIVKLAETVHISPPATTATPLVHKYNDHDLNRKMLPNDTDPPVYASAASTAAAEKIGDSSSPGQPRASAPPSSEHHVVNDSGYKLRSSINANADQNQAGLDLSGSPADTVKKRRRTASWMSGSLGPAIVAVLDDDDGERQRRKKYNQVLNTLTVCDNKDDQEDLVMGINDLDNSTGHFISDEALPEKLVASWSNCIEGVGQDFKSVKEFREALQKFAVAHRFAYKLKKNESNRASGICAEESCSWSIHASWVPDSQSFRVKKFNNSHTCGGESWKKAHPGKKLLVGFIKNKLRDSPHHKPKEIAKSISQDFGLELKYTQVRRGIEFAREQLEGLYKESYNRLPWFSEKFVETNAGSLVKLMTNDEKRLQCLFVSFHSCIQGFQYACRPILFLDSTSLNSKYEESLLLAAAVDADDDFFPIAFGIVDIENEDKWDWFLHQLKSALSTSLAVTFVSDMEKGLEKPIHDIFENSYHGYSMYHLVESFKRNLRGPFNGEGRGVLPAKLLAAAQSVRQSGFKMFTDQIRQISASGYEWINQINPEHWSSLSFRGKPYNHILENVAEPYAKLMIESRDWTIMQKIEALVYMINELINDRRTKSNKWMTTLTPSNEKKLQEAALKAHGLWVFISSDALYEVHDESTHVVNIEKRECTCLEWKGSGIPCRHAIATFNYLGRSAYDFCPKHLTAESYCITYAGSITPVPDTGTPSVEEDSDSGDPKVLPPALTTNQQKKKQSKTEDPDKRTVTCSRCKEPGHNKASCKTVL